MKGEREHLKTYSKSSSIIEMVNLNPLRSSDKIGTMQRNLVSKRVGKGTMNKEMVLVLLIMVFTNNTQFEDSWQPKDVF